MFPRVPSIIGLHHYEFCEDWEEARYDKISRNQLRESSSRNQLTTKEAEQKPLLSSFVSPLLAAPEDALSPYKRLFIRMQRRRLRSGGCLLRSAHFSSEFQTTIKKYCLSWPCPPNTFFFLSFFGLFF